MDGFKLTEKNISKYNPLNYSEEAVKYVNKTYQDKSKHQIDKESNTYGQKLFDADIEEFQEDMVDDSKVKFEERVKATRDYSRASAAALAKTDSFWGNSKEMKAVIKMVNGLNYILEEEEIPRTQDGNIDVDALKNRQLKGYEAAINACQYYIDVKEPSHSKGKRRYKRVENMKAALEKERELLETVILNISDGKYKEDELAGLNKTRDLLDKVHVLDVVGDAEIQIEGNSTDVYRIKLIINGEEKYFYFKQNLKPIGDDLPGYLKRRVRQLINSKKNIGVEKKEEERLHGKIDEADYDFGTAFLGKMQDAINKKGDDVKGLKAIRKRYTTFLGHDFDQIFEDLSKYNTLAEQSESQLADYMMRRDLAKEKNKTGEAAQIEKIIANHVVKHKMTEYEWLVKLSKEKNNPLGINMKDDKELFNILKSMEEKEDNTRDKKNGVKNNRISRLLTVTLGKEVEAYGQQKERSKTSEQEVMAKNNTATYRIANQYGFNDVITSSESAVINIKLVGDKNKHGVTGTISVEAPGVEMLKVVEIAEKNNRKIRYSPNAIRQLIRLQMFDTTCMQTDRHWRNFKCMTKPDLRDWDSKTAIKKDIVIESIGSYDHDMSFGTVDLETAFQNKNNPNGPSVKNGMLPPVIRKVWSQSPEGAYYLYKYTNMFNPNAFDKMKLPEPTKETEYGAKLINLEKVKKTFGVKKITYASMGIKDIDELPEIMVKGHKCYKYKGYLLEEDKDTSKPKYAFIVDENGERIGERKLATFLLTEAANPLEKMLDDKGVVKAIAHDSKMKNMGKQKVYSEIVNMIGDSADSLAKILIDEKQKSTINRTPKRFESLSKEQRIEAIKNSILILNGINKVDFSENATEKEVEPYNSHGTGKMEYELRTVVYYVHEELMSLPEKERDSLLAEAKKRVQISFEKYKIKERDESGNKIDNAKDNSKKKDKEENRMIEVPSMLHMDRQAYLSIVRMQKEFDSKVRYYLHDLGWEQEKINAFKRRIDQQLADIEKCKKMAEKILVQKYDENHPGRKFFLDEDDYDKFDDITDFAWDPGMSYFSTEDQNFLMSNDEFNTFVTEDERQKRVADNNEHRKEKRLHGLKQNLPGYETMIDGQLEIKEEAV